MKLQSVKIDDTLTVLNGTRLNSGYPIRLGVEGSLKIDDTAPIYIRESVVGVYEIAFLKVALPQGGQTGIKPSTAIGYTDCGSANALDSWKRAIDGDPEHQNLVGMRLSFHHNTEKNKDLFPDKLGLNWRAAKFWFERAAEQGLWAANNNLGVIYLNGYGVPKNPQRAFEYLMKASGELSPITIGHLERCFRDGEGCNPDPEMAEFLAELRALREEEERVMEERETEAEEKHRVEPEGEDA
ncbi:tetratricopeptide repeat protein [Microvirga soli]|uniref:tetratricopeptide repeat protein n=1 Tax=Microvirga soli TaxID=1854496 RepID=UPI00191F30A2|nr:tetratricopeptide repeat protein [Microvirga soli]